MGVLTRRPTQCVFCAFRAAAAAAAFSTTTARPRDKATREHLERQRIKRSRAQGKIQFHLARIPSSAKVSHRPLAGRDGKNGKDYDGSLGGTMRLFQSSKDEILRTRLKELRTRMERSNFSFDRRLLQLGLRHDELVSSFMKFQKRLLKSLESKDKIETDFIVKRMCDLAKGATETKEIDHEIVNAFIGDVCESKLPPTSRDPVTGFSDLRYPPEWYPATRGFRRTFHLHIGPTNSGKTYHALKRLESAESGLYAGPLRLLAHEVYSRLNARGKRCALVTGDDQRPADDSGVPANMVSCTVEMINTARRMDVAVIDEIQLLGDDERGWAWTTAVLGVQAREVHLCGEARTEPIVRELVGMCGDELHVHNYERLSPLSMMPVSLDGDLNNLRKGDCVVAFSISTIHSLRLGIEKKLKTKVAVIYGALPPETRAQQAELFNDPDSGYDILVASNAVGMGLNLSIKRMVFEASWKRISSEFLPLEVAEIKQIAGRAGRFRTAKQDVDSAQGVSSPTSPPKEPGLVTTLAPADLPSIANAMGKEADLITSAGILPPFFMIERFARYFPQHTPFSQIFLRLCQMAQLQQRFKICNLNKICGIADAIESVKGLSIVDRMTLCNAPIEPRKDKEPELACELANLILEKRPASVLELESLDLDLLEDDYESSRVYLKKIEVLHKGLMIYMWLSYRYPDILVDGYVANHAKSLTEQRIAKVLEQLSVDYEKNRKLRETRQRDARLAHAMTSDPNISSIMDSAMEQSFTDGVRLAELLSDATTERITQISQELDAVSQHEYSATLRSTYEPTIVWQPFEHQGVPMARHQG